MFLFGRRGVIGLSLAMAVIFMFALTMFVPAML